MIYLCIFRYDPNADIHCDIDTDQDRVIFIKTVAEFMVSLMFHVIDKSYFMF